MAKSYTRLVQQIKKLQRQADRMSKVRTNAISRVSALIDKFGIEMSELSGRVAKRGAKRGPKPGAKRIKRRGKVASKYRGPGGMTWSGRGLTPVWLRQAISKGKKKEDFLIKKS